MPGGDGTGPLGLGYRNDNVFWRREFFRRGRNINNWCGIQRRLCVPHVYDISLSKEQELEYFKQEAIALKQQLKEVEDRINMLENFEKKETGGEV